MKNLFLIALYLMFSAVTHTVFSQEPYRSYSTDVIQKSETPKPLKWQPPFTFFSIQEDSSNRTMIMWRGDIDTAQLKIFGDTMKIIRNMYKAYSYYSNGFYLAREVISNITSVGSVSEKRRKLFLASMYRLSKFLSEAKFW